MIGKKLYCIIVYLLPFVVQAQNLTDVTVTRERTFTGAGLYGFMNGGADLYLEYGVQKLITRDVVYKNENFTIDVYDFPSAADAFGLYSLHTFKCMRADTLACFNCLSTYQLQAAIGNQYISIVFQSGSNAARQAADELLHLYIPSSCNYSAVIPPQLELQPPYTGTLKYLRGTLSVSNAQSSLLATVEGVSFLGIWLIVDKATKQNQAFIIFANNTDLQQVTQRVEPADVISSGNNYLLIKTKKKDAEHNNYGVSFGF